MPKFVSFFVIILAAALALAPVVQAQDNPPANPSQQAPAPAPAKDSILKLKVTYKGAEGAVDETHKIWIFVFDSPQFSDGSGAVMPITAGSILENGGVASFTLYQTPVYIAVAYDKQGNYDFMGPPASGSPVAVYSKEPPTPAPIALTQGETIEVAMEFDDTAKMP